MGFRNDTRDAVVRQYDLTSNLDSSLGLLHSERVLRSVG
jgi:hypothetical protein